MKQLSTYEKSLLDVAMEEYADIPAEQDIDITFSQTFERKMTQLVHNEKRKTWHYVNTTAKKIILVALLSLLLLMSVAAAVPAIREGIIKFFTHNDGVAFTFEFAEDDVAKAPKEIETIYAPAYIPTGFSATIEDRSPNSFTRIYENESGQVIAYRQLIIWEKPAEFTVLENAQAVLGVDSEDATTQSMVVDGYEVMLITTQNNRATIYLWTDYDYFYVIDSDLMDTNEIIKMILSVQSI